MKFTANIVLLLFGAGLTWMIADFLPTAAFAFNAAEFVLLIAMAVVAVFCAAAFKSSATTRQVLALCLVSAAIAAVAAEFTVAGAGKASYADGGLGLKSARDALLDLRAGGDRAYVSLLHADITEPDAAGLLRSALKIDGVPVLPLSGVAGVTTVLCNETGQWVTYRADRFGFRNPASSWVGPVDLAAVGDSFAQGNCVADGESFVDLLRGAYANTVNLGQRGNGPFAILASIREYLGERRPKTTLWFYFEGNDIPSDMQREMRTPLFPRYLKPDFSQNLRQRAPEVSTAFARYIDRRLEQRVESPSGKLPPTVSWWQIARSRLSLYEIRSRLGVANFPNAEIAETFEAVLGTAKADIAKWNGELVLVYLPAKRRFTSAGARRSLDRYRNIVLAAAKTLDISVLDMTVPLEATPDPASLYRYHFTEEGHAFVADEVRKYLRSRRL